jgi:hypothetical protein
MSPLFAHVSEKSSFVVIYNCERMEKFTKPVNLNVMHHSPKALEQTSRKQRAFVPFSSCNCIVKRVAYAEGWRMTSLIVISEHVRSVPPGDPNQTNEGTLG